MRDLLEFPRLWKAFQLSLLFGPGLSTATEDADGAPEGAAMGAAHSNWRTSNA